MTPCEVQARWRPRTMLISRGNRSPEKQDPPGTVESGNQKGLNVFQEVRRTLQRPWVPKTVLLGSSGVASRTAAPS